MPQKTGELLVQIMEANDKSGAAVYPPSMEKRMAKLERDGLIERHHLANGKHCARITTLGRKEALVFCGENF